MSHFPSIEKLAAILPNHAACAKFFRCRTRRFGFVCRFSTTGLDDYPAGQAAKSRFYAYGIFSAAPRMGVPGAYAKPIKIVALSVI